MPFADVSDIIGKRNLVQEAQQWAQLGLEKRKVAMMEEKAQEQSKVKNYEFNQAEFGVENPYFSDQMRNLNDKSYQWVLANADLLKIDPTSPDASPEVKQAHRINANLQMSAKQISSISTNLSNKYKSNLNKMNNPQTKDLFNNSENVSLMQGVENLWKTFGADGSMFFDIDFNTGNLVIKERQKMQVQEANENGELLFINSDGKKVTQDDDAFDENSQPSMVEGEEFDEENVKTMNLDEWSNSVLKDVVPHDSSKAVSYEDIFRTIDGTATAENPKNQLNEREMKSLIQDKILGPGGIYSPDGSYILSSDGNAILRQWKQENPNSDLPSMDELKNFAFERAQAEYQTIARDTYKPPKTEEVDLGIYNDPQRFNQLYTETNEISENHIVSSPIVIGSRTSGIKTTSNLSNVFMPDNMDNLESFLQTEEGKATGKKEFDILVNSIGIKLSAIKTMQDGSKKQIYLNREQEEMSDKQLQDLGITRGDWVQVAIGVLTPSVAGKQDDKALGNLSRNNVLPKDAKSSSAIVVLPINKILGKVGGDDFPIVSTLDKVEKRRNSANTSSNIGVLDNL